MNLYQSTEKNEVTEGSPDRTWDPTSLQWGPLRPLLWHRRPCPESPPTPGPVPCVPCPLLQNHLAWQPGGYSALGERNSTLTHQPLHAHRGLGKVKGILLLMSSEHCTHYSLGQLVTSGGSRKEGDDVGLLVKGMYLGGRKMGATNKTPDSNVCTKNGIKCWSLFLSKFLHFPKEPWPVAATMGC